MLLCIVSWFVCFEFGVRQNTAYQEAERQGGARDKMELSKSMPLVSFVLQVGPISCFLPLSNNAALLKI